MIAASDQLKHYLHDRYEGRDMGISAVGTFGYLFAFTIVLYLLIKHILHSNLLVTYKGSIGDSRHDALNRNLQHLYKCRNSSIQLPDISLRIIRLYINVRNTLLLIHKFTDSQ